MNISTAPRHTTAVLSFPTELLLRAQAIRVAVFDVDGVLTDGGLYFTEQGETLKRFHTLDGHGLKLLQSAGITPVVVSGRDSAPLRERLRALGVQHSRFGTEAKVTATEELLQTLGCTWDQVAAIGDDWPDLPVLQRAALAVAPPGAHPEVLARVHHVTRWPGGGGAGRELCDLLLVAQGSYQTWLDQALV